MKKNNIFNINVKRRRSPEIKEVMILGSTGSVGKNAFEVCMQFPHEYNIKTIVCNTNIEEATRQALLAKPKYVVIGNRGAAETVKKNLDTENITVLHSAEVGIVMSEHYDYCISAVPGISGVQLTFDAIKCSDTLLFANKETIIYAGELLLDIATKYQTNILPIDSEHSAIFQLLAGVEVDAIKKIILTASGGSLWNKKIDEIYDVAVDDVLKHPNWRMGGHITINSATMANKALEVIEAVYLFGCDFDDIDVIIHPEQIVHGMVYLTDGTTLMHASPCDMKLPIAYALSWPQASSFTQNNVDLTRLQMNFHQPNNAKFPMMNLIIEAAKKSTANRIVANIANEIAVEMFLHEQIKFGQIYELVKEVLHSNNAKYNETNIFDEHISQINEIYQSVRNQLNNICKNL